MTEERTLVLTGAGGWLGTSLLRRLSDPGSSGQRYPVVRALAAAPSEVPHILSALPSAAVFVGDVRSDRDIAALFDGLHQPDVVHAAGVIHPESVADFDLVNAGGSARIARFAVASTARRMVHISSNSAFGLNADGTDEFRDDDAYHPYLGYGRSKMLAERAVLSAVSETSTTSVILRPPWFYGPFGPARQVRFLRAVRMGRFPEPADVTVRRSLVDVRSLAHATHAALASTEAAGRAYWVADARPLAFSDLLDQICIGAERAGLDTHRRRVPVPGWVTHLMRRADAALQQRGRYSAEVHVIGELGASIACRVDGAARDLEWAPYDDPADGWAAAYTWALEQGQEP